VFLCHYMFLCCHWLYFYMSCCVFNQYSAFYVVHVIVVVMCNGSTRWARLRGSACNEMCILLLLYYLCTCVIHVPIIIWSVTWIIKCIWLLFFSGTRCMLVNLNKSNLLNLESASRIFSTSSVTNDALDYFRARRGPFTPGLLDMKVLLHVWK
jgi:hypothetical protein